MKVDSNYRLIGEGGNPVQDKETPNKGGTLDPQFLIMHFTAARSAASAIDWLLNPASSASAHLVIARDGTITQLAPFNRVTWHAGKSSWGELSGLNKYSIGIELDNAGKMERKNGKWTAWFGATYPETEVHEAKHKNDGESAGWHIFTEVQLEVAAQVAATLVQHYELRDILGHDDIAPGRKNDPGPAFPMESFKSVGEGRAADEDDFFVTTDNLSIRTGPGTQNPTVIAKALPPGTLVVPLAREGKWWKVDVEDTVDGTMDLQGWVHSGWLKPWIKPAGTTTMDMRLRMGLQIVNFEARRDAQGRIAVYKIPSGDGGGAFEIAGINDRYHSEKAWELRTLIENGRYDEAERAAAEHIAGYTDRVDPWAENPGIEFYLRDSAFNRGPGGAARILQLAVGVKPDGAVGKLTREAAAKAEQEDPKRMMLALRAAREQYEITFIGKREKFWKGLTNRWNKALTFAQSIG
jgi:N-acetylmuramoyl-L-alanine amidase